MRQRGAHWLLGRGSCIDLPTPRLKGKFAIPSLFNVTLVLGGARSGKSRHAETLLMRHAGPWVYVATGEPLDDEMRQRIADHERRRGPGWRTFEEPIALSEAIIATSELPVLVDCLTLWLTNLMLGDHDIEAASAALEAALAARPAPTILVSNEVGLGLVPDTGLGRAFRDQAGRLNQRIAAQAGRVLFMVAGLPLTVK